MPKRVAAAVAGKQAAAIGVAAAVSRTMSVGYNDTNAMGNVKVSNVNKSHNDRAEGEKSAVVAAAVAKCIDRSAISIYGTRSQHADMSIRITHINSALSFHSFQRSSMARVVVVCLSTCVLKKMCTQYLHGPSIYLLFLHQSHID